MATVTPHSWCSCARGCSSVGVHDLQLTRRQVLMGAVSGMAGLMSAGAAGSGPAAAGAGTLKIGGDLNVNRLGFGAMRITGRGIWGEPEDPQEARAVLQRAVALGVN